MSLKFHEMTIDAYLSALGSTAPAPGGGAAAGLIGAQACALGEMVSRLSSSGKNTDDFREKAEQYVAVFESARSIFLDGTSSISQRSFRHKTERKIRSGFQKIGGSALSDGGSHERTAPRIYPAPASLQ